MSAKRQPRKGTTASATPTLNWRKKVRLQPGETLRLVGQLTRGNLAQEDIEEHEVVDASGQVTGAVRLSSKTALKPPCVTRYLLEHRDAEGRVIAEERW
jgi:hypothetical protein